MKIAIGCDPNAEEAKQEIIAYIEKKGYGEVTDFGSEDPIYANVAIDVAEHVASGEYDRGVLICGTGLGVSIAANKVKSDSVLIQTIIENVNDNVEVIVIPHNLDTPEFGVKAAHYIVDEMKKQGKLPQNFGEN